MKIIGTVNGAIIANLLDKDNKVLGTTIDTPNAIAYAMAVNPQVVKAIAHYQMFGDTIHTREELSDRFEGVMWDKEVLSSYLKWV